MYYVPTVSFLFGNSVACETTRVVYSSLFDYIYVCTLILYHIYRPSDFLIAHNLPILESSRELNDELIDFTHSDFVVANPSVPRFIWISPDDFSLDEYILKDIQLEDHPKHMGVCTKESLRRGRRSSTAPALMYPSRRVGFVVVCSSLRFKS